MKQAIFKLVEKGSHGSKKNLVFDYFITILIILNVIAIAIESINGLTQVQIKILKYFENISILVFTIEFLLRVYVSDLTHPSNRRIKSIFKFILSPFGLVDLFAILPFYMPFIFTFDLRFIRVLRLFRFFRIFKINRYNNSLKLIGSVIKDKKTELGMTLFVTFLILILASFLMYYIEGPIQPDKFPNIFATIWWAVATLTTIGYGDVYPLTGFGKVLSGLIAVLGIGLVALPTGLISAGFIEKINENKHPKKCPHCGKPIDN